MIAYLKGKPNVQTDRLIVNVNNVGYGVYVGSRLLATADPDQELELYIFTHVREDRLELYGFQSPQQLRLFELMTDVSGIGPKTALAIVDQDPQKIIEAVQQAKVGFFTPIPRVGKKVAQKIILELKSKLGSLKELDLGPQSQEEQDLRDALLKLGFDQDEILAAIEEIDLEETDLQQAVKQALSQLR